MPRRAEGELGVQLERICQEWSGPKHVLVLVLVVVGVVVGVMVVVVVVIIVVGLCSHHLVDTDFPEQLLTEQCVADCTVCC